MAWFSAKKKEIRVSTPARIRNLKRGAHATHETNRQQKGARTRTYRRSIVTGNIDAFQILPFMNMKSTMPRNKIHVRAKIGLHVKHPREGD